MEIPYTIEGCCPLCERDLAYGDKLLYDFRVCPKCYNNLGGRRRAAFLIDVVIFRVLHWAAIASAVIFASTVVAIILADVAIILLFALKDGLGGRSPGKWILGLQVIHRETHEPIGFGASLRRNLPIVGVDLLVLASFIGSINSPLEVVAVVFVIAKPAALLYMAFQLNRGPRWGDGLAGTKVIRTSLAYRPPFDIRGMRCVSCGYDLTGNVSGICPECGTPVGKLSPVNWHVKRDAADQLSVTVARSQDHFADRG